MEEGTTAREPLIEHDETIKDWARLAPPSRATRDAANASDESLLKTLQDLPPLPMTRAEMEPITFRQFFRLIWQDKPARYGILSLFLLLVFYWVVMFYPMTLYIRIGIVAILVSTCLICGFILANRRG